MTAESPAPSARRSSLWRVYLGTLGLLAIVQAIVFGWLFFGPSTIYPYAWQPLAMPELSGAYAPNDAITRGRLLATQWIESGRFDRIRYQGVGPETVAIGPDGALYTGLCDGQAGGTSTEPPPCRTDGHLQGWIVRIDPRTPNSAEPFVRTGGRPLGLAFDTQGRLYVADAQRGLLRVEPLPAEPGAGADTRSAAERARSRLVVPVATCSRSDAAADPLPHYADSVAVAPDGSVWFTCPTQRWSLGDIRNEIIESQPTGRVLRYQPCSDREPLRCRKSLEVDNLLFANGIAVIDQGRALLVNEWTGFRITRLDLDAAGHVSGQSTFFENTPGYPDNLTVDDDGIVWVGLSLMRQPLVERFRNYPFLLSALSRLPPSLMVPRRHAWVIGIDSSGRLAHNLQDASGFFDQATGAYPVDDALYIGSYSQTALACIRHPRARNADGPDPCDPWARPQHPAL